jgi:hypothetical protein
MQAQWGFKQPHGMALALVYRAENKGHFPGLR